MTRATSFIFFRFIAFLFLSFYSFSSFFPTETFAQTGSQTELGKLHFIITNDGKEILGVIEKETDTDILVVTKTKEEILIQKSDIKTIEQVHADNFHRGKYVRANSVPNMYYFTTSAIPLDKKTSTLTAYANAFSFDYGLTKNISLGIRSTVVGIPVIMNVQVNSEIGNQLYLGVSGNACWLSWADPKLIFGWGGAKLTSGSKNNNSTLGAGFLKIDLDFRNPRLDDFAYVNVSSMKRITKKMAFSWEVYSLKNLYLRQYVFMANLGIKTMKREKSSWSFFLINIIYFEFRSGDMQYIPIPVASWSKKFGKSKY